jgi:hypothetical protein
VERLISGSSIVNVIDLNERDLRIQDSYFSGYKFSSFFLVCVFSFSINPSTVSKKLVSWRYSAKMA